MSFPYYLTHPVLRSGATIEVTPRLAPHDAREASRVQVINGGHLTLDSPLPSIFASSTPPVLRK
ncbi:hypothetical protein BH23ACT11_BH23ACT11_20390 [soil metagenome]